MITQEDRSILRDVGREYLLDIALDSQVLKEKLTFKEHAQICNEVKNLSYEEVIALTITEDLKTFENKFKKFLKYGFAAIAGAMTFGMVGPPIAMFVLYTYRKFTDTCSRRCITRLPGSSDRKICRYECQVQACKNIVRDLRSEINKCAGMRKPEKCEKSLQKEYVKWSKRLQQQIIKLNQAKLGKEQKEREKYQKKMVNRAKTIASSYQVPMSQMKTIVTEDIRFRKLPMRVHLELYSTFSNLQEENEPIVQTPKVNPNTERWSRRALYLGLWVVPIPFFNDVVNHIIKKHNFSCTTKCLKQKKFSHKLCSLQCNYLAAKYANDLLKKQMTKCDKSDKPIKCKKKINSLLYDWKQREVENKIKFQSQLRAEMAKAKRDQSTQQGKE
jgi:hypothetical protein